jgi:TetR/AcrR family transcriptional repressor of nem operon
MNTTYTNILQHADELIQQNGFNGFSYADLAKTLGMTKASIHHHFPAKADLGIAYCLQKSEDLTSLHSQLKTKKMAQDQLRGYFSIFDSCAADQKMCGIYAMQSDLLMMSPELQKQVNKLAGLELTIVSAILQNGLESGDFHFKVSAYQQAVIICCAIKGALMLNRSQHQGLFKLTCDALLATMN